MIIEYKESYGGFLFNIDKNTFLSILEDSFELKELWFKDIGYTDNIKYYIEKERQNYTNEKKEIKVHQWLNGKLWISKGHFYLVGASFLSMLAQSIGANFRYTGSESTFSKIHSFNFVGGLKLFPHQEKIINKITNIDKNNNQLTLIKKFWDKLLKTRITYSNISLDNILNLTKKYFPFLEDDISSGYVISPARSGKTITMLALAQKLGLRTLVIVDKELIFNQFKERLHQFTDLDLNKQCRFYQGAKSFGKFNNNVIIGVGMIQTISKLFDHTTPSKLELIKEELGKYDLVLVDEAHSVATETFMRTLSGLKFKKIFGFTATKMRGDGNHRLLDYYIGETIIKIEQKEVGDMVYNIHIYPKKIKHNNILGFIKTQKNGNTKIDKWAIKKLYNDNKRNNLIIKDVEKALENDRLVIVIGETLEHLDYLAHEFNIRFKKKFNTNKDIAYVINSKTKKKDREAILNVFTQAGKDRANDKEYYPKILLATASLLGKGFDGPYFDTIFLVAPLGAKKKERGDDGRAGLVQVVNRIGNKIPGKKQPICVDYIDIEPEGVLVNMARSRYWNVYKDRFKDLNHNFIVKGSWDF